MHALTKVSSPGPIIGLNVLSKTLVIVDTAEDAKQLFWTRNANYSNRVSMTMVQMCASVIRIGRYSLWV